MKQCPWRRIWSQWTSALLTLWWNRKVHQTSQRTPKVVWAANQDWNYLKQKRSRNNLWARKHSHLNGYGKTRDLPASKKRLKTWVDLAASSSLSRLKTASTRTARSWKYWPWRILIRKIVHATFYSARQTWLRRLNQNPKAMASHRAQISVAMLTARWPNTPKFSQSLAWDINRSNLQRLRRRSSR